MFQPVGHGTAKSVCSYVLLGHNLGNNQFPGRDRWQDVPRDINISTCHMPIIYASCKKNRAVPLEAQNLTLKSKFPPKNEPGLIVQMGLVWKSPSGGKSPVPMARSFRDRTKVRLWRAWGDRPIHWHGKSSRKLDEKKGDYLQNLLDLFFKCLWNRLVVEPPGP